MRLASHFRAQDENSGESKQVASSFGFLRLIASAAMNHCRLAMLTPLLAVLGVLLSLAGSASAAINYDAQKAHYGNFLPWEQPALGEIGPQAFDLLGNNDFVIYDGALGVEVYVRQNPWTYFDPLGLESSEWHHRYPQEYRGKFEEMGIDIDKAENGKILKRTDHKHLHGRGYNEAWKKHFEHLDADTSLTKSARKGRTEAFLRSLEDKPKFKAVLRRGAPVPLGMKHNKEYKNMDKAAKANMFRQVWGHAKGGKALQYLGNAAKVGGKVFKVAGIAMIPSQYAQGAEYASDVYGAGGTMQDVSGTAQAVLPFGPSEATATWDMRQSQIAKEGARMNKNLAPMSGERWGLAAERVLNPASPRWIPTQAVRSAWEWATE